MARAHRAGALILLALGILALPITVDAQRPGKVARIGYLVVSPLVDPPTAERQAFLDGLRELGYVEGQNIVIEYRSAKWNRELLPDLAEELVNLKVDVIVAVPGTIEAARQATKTIPIVIPTITDPTETKLVASLARPGGNITGTGWSPREVAGKRLALLKEAFPKISRVAVLLNPAAEQAGQEWPEAQAAARRLRLTLQLLEVSDPKDFPGAFATMTRKRPDALVTVNSPLTSAYRPIIIEFATKNRLPTMFSSRAEVEAGGLMAYAPSLLDAFRRTAGYVDKILKGANPGDLPIEQPTRYDLIVNLQTAKVLRLTLPQSLLLRATEIIR
jgi:putative ABC transport system substrate-binding protein